MRGFSFSKLASFPAIELLESEHEFVFKNEDFILVFQKNDAKLKSYKFNNLEYLYKENGPLVSFWRGMTDNDFGSGFPTRAAYWKTASDSITLSDLRLHKISAHEYQLSAQYELAQNYGTLRIDYFIFASGELYVQQHLNLNENIDISELPRFGMTMYLNPEFNQLKWYGRGPQENYWDRKNGYKIGIYESTTEEQYVPYIRPQENSNLTDVRWATLRNKNNEGLMIAGFPMIEFSAQNYILEDFDQPDKKVNKHTTDIQQRDFISVDMDFSQTGMAGDDSWWSRAHPEYTLYPDDYCYSFRIRPLTENESETSAYKIRPLIKSEFCEKPSDDYFREKIQIKHKAIGKPVEINGNYSGWFSAGGKDALTNGFIGTQNYGDDNWMGFYDQDVEFVLDLETIQLVEQIQLHFLKDLKNHFYLPSSVELYISKEGDVYENIEVKIEENNDKKLGICTLGTDYLDRKTRYIRLRIQQAKVDHRQKGNAFLVDEIVVK